MQHHIATAQVLQRAKCRQWMEVMRRCQGMLMDAVTTLLECWLVHQHPHIHMAVPTTSSSLSGQMLTEQP